jgi:hypothetical protein
MNGSTNWAEILATQWLNPSDALSILLLLGPDIVQRAVAQQAGRSITPVAFSFGWVAYATGALLSAFGGKSPEICGNSQRLNSSRWKAHAKFRHGQHAPDRSHDWTPKINVELGTWKTASRL